MSNIFNLILSALTGKAKTNRLAEYKNAKVFLTAKDTSDRLADKGSCGFEPLPQPKENTAAIILDPDKTFQEILGFGGALTDAAAETFYKLPKSKQDEFISACYDQEKGLGYTLGRTNINSCDFSSGSYDYVQPGDLKLDSFSISHDLKYKVPFIKEALKLQPAMKLYGSPWSPPAWMKTNNNMLQGGKLKPECYESWAKYYIRFVGEYRKEGIPVWGLTVQNEPMAAQKWESCIYTAEEERDFVKNYLGPALHGAGMSDIKLIVWDHNRGIMYQRAKTVFDDPAAEKYVWGTGFHWYSGNNFDNVRLVHDSWPEKHLLFTEGCSERFDSKNMNEWKFGEDYARSMIHDLNNRACGWTDWNVLLDEKGGPNHVGNFCFAPVMADTRTGKLNYLSSYWYIGHITRFIRPGAKRIIASSNMDDLLAAAFLNTDGSIACVILNESEKETDIMLWIDGKAAKTRMPEHSIVTFVAR